MTTLTEKQLLTNFRNEFFRGPWRLTPRMAALEEKFGKYAYVPLDLDPITPDDPIAFKQWYLGRSKQVMKVKSDVAGPPQTSGYSFLGVNSPGFLDTIWESNPDIDLFEKFPEIRVKMQQLPYKDIITSSSGLQFQTLTPEYNIWSSQRIVSPHRDQGPWCDLPASLRIMLYDENPVSTLYVKNAPSSNMVTYSPPFKLPRLETNTFAWNNLRTKHGSSHNPQFVKILMIMSHQTFDLDKYEALLERSVEKFKDHCFVLDCSIKEYVN